MTGEEIWDESADQPRFNRPNNTITLVHVFQIVTGCCLFFACMRVSPLLAIVLTIIITPAIIRTGMMTNQLRNANLRVEYRDRFRFFMGSIVISLMTIGTGLLVFLIVSACFGLICVAIAFATMRTTDLLADVGFIGTLGGTIWGSAAGLLSLSWTQMLWRLPSIENEGSLSDRNQLEPASIRQ